MSYVVLSDLNADIPPEFLTQALDDDGDGAEDAGLWNLIAQQVSDQIDALIGVRYAVPLVPDGNGNFPALIANAGRVLAAEKLYGRRAVGDLKNPWVGRANAVRAQLMLIGQLRAVADAMAGMGGAARAAVSPVKEVASAEHGAATHAKEVSKDVRDAAVGFRGLGGAAAEAGKLIRDGFLAVPEVAVVVGLFAGVAESVNRIRDSFKYGSQLQTLSAQTGETAANMAALRSTFDYFNISADQVGETLFMLQRALGGVGERGGSSTGAFARLGLSIQQLKALDAPAQLLAIQAGFAKLPDQAAKSAVAMQIFGESARDIQAILNANPVDFSATLKSAQDYAQVMGQNASAFDAIEGKFFLFRQQLDTIFARIAAGLAPAVQNLLTLVNKVDFSKWARDIEVALKMFTYAFTDGDVFKLLGLGLKVALGNYLNAYAKNIMALISLFTTSFMNAPRLLRDAFGTLTNPQFWIGIGEMVLGGFLSIQGRLNQIFIHLGSIFTVLLEDAATSFGRHMLEIGHVMAGVLIGDPFALSGLAKMVGGAVSSVGSRVKKQDLVSIAATGSGMADQGDAMFKAGAANVEAAVKSTPYLGDLKAELVALKTAMTQSMKGTKLFDTSGPLSRRRRLNRIMLGLPREPLPGQPLRAADMAAFVRYVKNSTTRSSPGSLVTPGSGGLTQRRIGRPKYYQWPTGAVNIYPYQVTDASDADGAKVTVRPGTHNGFMPQIYGAALIPPVTTPPTAPPKLDVAGAYTYVQFDGTYDAAGNITMSDGLINTADDVPITTVTPAGDGSGTFTFYEALAATQANSPATEGGSYSVTVYQLVQTIRTLYMCGDTLVVVS